MEIYSNIFFIVKWTMLTEFSPDVYFSQSNKSFVLYHISLVTFNPHVV